MSHRLHSANLFIFGSRKKFSLDKLYTRAASLWCVVLIISRLGGKAKNLSETAKRCLRAVTVEPCVATQSTTTVHTANTKCSDVSDALCVGSDRTEYMNRKKNFVVLVFVVIGLN